MPLVTVRLVLGGDPGVRSIHLLETSPSAVDAARGSPVGVLLNEPVEVTVSQGVNRCRIDVSIEKE